MADKITLKNPIKVAGKVYRELTYDLNKINIDMFTRAEAIKLKLTTERGGGTALIPELDYSFHLALGMMAIIAENSDIDVDDMMRIEGQDVRKVQKIGQLFMLAPEESDLSNSGDTQELTQNTLGAV